MTEPTAERVQRKTQAMRYVASLDGLRALAALGVVIIHTESEANASIPVYVVTGTITGPFFMLFFAISGFVLYRGWARRHLAMGVRRDPNAPKAAPKVADGGADGRTAKYLLRRLIRIYPLYWVVATAALLVSDNTGKEHSVMDLVQVYLLLPFPNTNALVELGLGIVVWTLIIDIVFYAYVALHGMVMTKVIKATRKRHTPFSVESAVLITMGAVILFAALFVPAPLSALVCLPMGMYFAVIEARQDQLGHLLSGVESMVKAWPVWIIMFVVLAPLVDLIAIEAENYGEFLSAKPGIHMLLVLVGSWLLIHVLWAPPQWPVPRFFRSPFMRTAGLLTYGTYLWHPVILILLDQNLPDGSLPVYLVITVFGSVALASITYVLVERPLGRIRGDMRKVETDVVTNTT
ncbi:MAG: putative integral rane acyltransferase [Ilumatobacteraceae bacterium]|nr:putative integral rane acyltransferase [Ilumatobacteraceae bacterium]